MTASTRLHQGSPSERAATRHADLGGQVCFVRGPGFTAVIAFLGFYGSCQASVWHADGQYRSVRCDTAEGAGDATTSYCW